MGTYKEDIVPPFAKDHDWDVQTLLEIASIYHEISVNSDQIVRLACAKGVTVAEVYGECKKAQAQIAERVKQLQVKA